jgi:hypothetical protein
MKKSALLVAALAFGATTAFAQLESKKGEPFLPEAGDWSLGIEATPFLNYFGNFIGGNGLNSAPTWNFLNGNNMITGKMYTSETSAYRVGIRLGFSSSKMSSMVNDDAVTTPPTFPNAPTMKEDIGKWSSHVIGLNAGMEMRRGKTRLQGFYGGEFLIWMSGSKEKYEYGNAYSSTNTAPTTTNWGTNVAPTYAYWGGRVMEAKSGSTIGIGVRGFVGCEYFVLPKMSIGAEFGWGLGYAMTGAGEAEVESQDPATPGAGVVTTYTTSGKSSGLVLDVDRNAFGTGNGSLRLNFHF